MIGKIALAFLFMACAARAANVIPDNGPFAGGNTVLVTNAAPNIGDGSDITSVTVGGVAASVTGQGLNWVAFTAPATGSAGAKDVVIQSTSVGVTTLAGAYNCNPAGEIGGTTIVFKWSAVADALVPGQANAKGANNTIYGIDYFNNTLYAGGAFTNIGGSNCARVAQYDGTNWTSMGLGVQKVANVNCVKGGPYGVYAGGYFTNIGGANMLAVGRWDGTNWNPMGHEPAVGYTGRVGLGFSATINGYVNWMEPYKDNTVIAGGYFTNSDFRAAGLHYIAKYDGAGWTNMQEGFRNVTLAAAYDRDRDHLYVGGSFTNHNPPAASLHMRFIARWDGVNWTNMAQGFGNRVTCMAVNPANGDLYIGGWFTNYFDGAGNPYPANYVAKWDPVSQSLTNVGSGFNNWVYALKVAPDGTLYAGGSFTNTYLSTEPDKSAPPVATRRIAMWNGTHWTNMGNGLSDTVLTLTVNTNNSDLYAAGFFRIAYQDDGTDTNTWYIARYGSEGVISTGVDPATGPVTGGFEVVISGSNLGGGDITNVTLCGASVASIVSQSATQVVVEAGASSSGGLGDVRVYSTSYGETVKSNAFTYTGPAFALLGTNGEVVANSAAPDAAVGTHFGEVLSGVTMTNVFSITNTGTSTLNLSWTTNGSSAFSVVSGPSTVDAGTAADFAVTYASSGAAATATVHFVHDAAFSPFILNLAADSSLLEQTITFPAIADQVTTDLVGLAATASSGLPVSFDVLSGSASISGNTNLSFSGAGSVSIVASQAGNASYEPAPNVTNTFTVTKAVATVTLTNLVQVYDGTARVAGCITVPAGLTVDFTYDGADGAPTNVGSYAVTGTVNEVMYQGDAAGTLVVNKGIATVTLTNLNQTYDGTPKPAGATTDPSGLTVALTYDGNPTAPTAVGSYTVTGTVVEANWQGEAIGTLVIGKISQTITFAPIPPQKTAASVGLAATGGDSGNPVTFAVTDGPGSITDDTNLTFSAAGDVIVVASQAGTANYEQAADVTNIVKVFSVTPNNGPFAGGNSVTISNGNFGTITNVLVGGVAATIEDSGASWVTITMPATGIAGLKDVVVQTDGGDVALAGAYTYNPAGWIIDSDVRPDWSRWTEVVGLPQGLRYMDAATLDGRIYLGGGMYTVIVTNVLAFDGTNWAQAAGLPAIRRDVAVSELNGKLYSMGGQTAVGTYANVYAYDGTSWSSVASLPAARTRLRAGTLNGTIYAVGGSSSTTTGTGMQTNVYAFDGTSWSEVAGLPMALEAMSVEVLNGSLYSIGGGANGVTNVFRFDGTDWTAEAGLPAPRTYMGSAVMDGKIYVVGGMDTMTRTNVYAYDGTNWTEVAALPGARRWLAASVLNDHIYAMGGASGTTALTNVFKYPSTETVYGVTPSNGVWTGGYPVVITGTNLGNGTDITSVTLCGATATINSQTASRIWVQAGSAAVAGAGDVRVFSTSFGETVKSNAFEYLRVSQAALTFTPDSPQTYLSTNALSVSGGSGTGAVSYTVLSGPGMIVNDTDLAVTAGSGTIEIRATKAQDDLYFMASVTGTVTAAKAMAGVYLLDLAQTYDGTAKSVAATSDPAGLTIQFTYNGSATAPTAAGSYAVTGTVNDADWQGTASGTLVISKGTAGVFLQDLAQTYDGTARTITATTMPAGLTVEFTYDGTAWAPTNVGIYAVTGTVNDANWQGTASGTLVISKGTAGVFLQDLAQTYDGTAKSVTATSDPSGLTIEFSYDGSPTPPSDAGSYAVTGTVNDANWQGTADGTLIVSKGAASVYLLDLAQTYDGTAKSVTATSDPAGLTIEFTYNGSATAPTAAGSYAVTGTVNDVNWQGAADGTLIVSKGAAKVYLLDLTQTYDGTAKSASATTMPAGLTVEFTYNGSSTSPSEAGSYAVTGTVNDANWQGDETGTLTIGKAGQVITFPLIVPQKVSATVGLAATGGGSGNPVTFAAGAPGGITDSTNLSFTGVGDVKVVASQAGNADYEAAPDVTNVVKVFSVTPDVGPFAGGHNVTISNGYFGTITNVLVGGVAADIEASGANWATITMPAVGSYGIKDIVIQTSDNGATTLPDAYTVGARVQDLPLGSVVYDDDWTWNGQVLAWRVVHSNFGGAANTVTLQATNSVAGKALIDGAWNNRWQDATLRTWLNSTNFLGFFSPAFSSIVLRTAVPWALSNPVNPPISGVTTDQVFIASRTELGGTELAGDGSVFDWFADPGTAAARRADLSPSPMAYWTRTGERAQYSGVWYDLSAYYVNVPAGTITSGSWTGDGLQVIPVVNIPGTAEFAIQPDGRYKLFGPMDQIITFPNPGDQITTSRVELAATATSRQDVSFEVLSGPANIVDGNALVFTNAGEVVVVASQPGNAYWNPAPNLTNTFTVSKAMAQVFLLDLEQTYNGAARTTTTTTMPAGLTVEITYDGNIWAPTNAGSYAVTGTVAEAMWQGSANGTLVVNKADATIVVGGVTVTYNGLGHGATGTATGVQSEDLSGLLELGAIYTNAPGGTAEWTFAGNSNHNATNGQVEIVINMADATIVVDGATVTYDGLEHGATGTATGVMSEDLSGLLDLGAKYISVPGGTANWTFAGNANYSATNGQVEIVIEHRELTVTADNQSKVYDGDVFPYTDYTVSYAGFVDGEGPADLGGKLDFAGSAIAAVDVGEYEITPQGLTSDNYDIRFVDGILSILLNELRINCGGNDSGDWSKDYGFSGKTKKYAVSRNIKRTGNVPQKVMQNLRGVFAPNRLNYSFAQVPAGEYIVVLHFADIYLPGQGKARFDVSIEGARVLGNFDVNSAAGGYDRAVAVGFRITVDADGLQLEFRPRKGGAYINGIEVLPIDPPDAADEKDRTASAEIEIASGEQLGASIKAYPVDVWTSGDGNWTSCGSNAVDGNLLTAWTGKPDADTWWIALGYRELTPVSEVTVFLGAESVTNLSFIGSRDGLKWFDIEEALLNGPAELEYLWIQFNPAEWESDLIPNVLEIEGQQTEAEYKYLT
jgi:N-acetylneuraminic acid mutarotase/hydrogenase maturation factor